MDVNHLFILQKYTNVGIIQCVVVSGWVELGMLIVGIIVGFILGIFAVVWFVRKRRHIKNRGELLYVKETQAENSIVINRLGY